MNWLLFTIIDKNKDINAFKIFVWKYEYYKIASKSKLNLVQYLQWIFNIKVSKQKNYRNINQL